MEILSNKIATLALLKENKYKQGFCSYYLKTLVVVSIILQPNNIIVVAIKATIKRKT